MKVFSKTRVFIIGYLLLLGMVHGRTMTNSPNEVAAPRQAFPLVYTIHTEKAVLQEKKNHQVELILKNVFENFNIYKNADSSHSPRLGKIGQLVNDWKAYAPTKLVAADLTGVQVDKNSIGHVQFYASVLLTDPVYSPNSNELRFRIVKWTSTISMNAAIYFNNVTVFLNGCDLSNCNKK